MMKAKKWKDKRSNASLTVGENGGGPWITAQRTENDGFTIGMSSEEARTLAAWLLEAATAFEEGR